MKKIKQPPSIDELLARQRKRILAQFNFGTIKTLKDYLLLGLQYHPSLVEYAYDKRNGVSIVEQLKEEEHLTKDQLINLLNAEEWRIKHYQYDYKFWELKQGRTDNGGILPLAGEKESFYSGEKLPTPADEEKLHHHAHEQCFIANSLKRK